jgi:hypothetical protein
MKIRSALSALFALGILGTGLTVAVSAQAWSMATSVTQIPAGQTFLLGGGQARGFVLEARNTGSVDVEILVVNTDGTQTSVAVLAPNQHVRQNFQPGQGAAARNRSSSVGAEMFFQFNAGVSSLGMRYKDNG